MNAMLSSTQTTPILQLISNILIVQLYPKKSGKLISLRIFIIGEQKFIPM